MTHGLLAAIEEMRRPTLELASASISNGSSVISRTVPATRRGAFLLAFDGVVEAGRLWIGHPSIMGWLSDGHWRRRPRAYECLPIRRLSGPATAARHVFW